MKKIMLLIAAVSIGYYNHTMGAWSQWHTDSDACYHGTFFDVFEYCAQLQEEFTSLSDAELETAITKDLPRVVRHFTTLLLKNCPNITVVPTTVQNLKNLGYITIINCRSFSNLETLWPLKQLKKIRIIGCPLISDDAVTKLEEKLPKCTIICRDSE